MHFDLEVFCMKKDVRALYLEFFKNKGHKVYQSMPLVPDDASLLFTNAGMVQFKDIFTGKVPIPMPNIATSSQLCIRAGGKHNDLENVGYTSRHHTLFEMLGNFSFGGYFKKEAIAYAWEFVTEVLGFDKEVLYVTIHKSDDEAYELWCSHISPHRIKRMGDKDNFWQMGDTGPCGPCSEIFVDQGEEYFKGEEDYFGGDGDRFLEIWNLVFMQYERDKEGNLKPLPKPSIDTGMGLERVMALLEGKRSNFDSSLFMPLIAKVEEIAKKKYIYKSGASFRVIADHSRAIAFLLAQGVNFDKEGRGYVLRRILRRAVRHGYLLGIKEAFLYKVLEVVCVCMGEHYAYLKEKQEVLQSQCKAEEERFFETLENGMSLFGKELKKIKNEKTHQLFSGEVAFRLYDTYGFPLDLTQDMLREEGLGVDMDGFEACMQKQKEQAKAHWKGSGDSLKEGDFKKLLESFGKNTFIGYETSKSEGKILALLDEEFKEVRCLENRGYVMFDKTPLYPESGGAIGDRGEIFKFDNKLVAKVLDTKKYFGLNISQIEVLETLRVGDRVIIKVNDSRVEIVKHHSATHLLHKALRDVLGTHIAQAGSLVEPNRLRFDFSHPKPLNSKELEQIELMVNQKILESNPQVIEEMTLDEAKNKGAMALFGEKYGERVRVITFGDSIELCGGIHVENTANIGSFYITKESGVSSGVRRIEAVCGRAAYDYGKSALEQVCQAKEALKTQDLLMGIEKLKEQIKLLKNTQQKSQSLHSFKVENLKGVSLIIARVDLEDIKVAIDEAKNKYDKVVILLINKQGKIAAGVKNAPIKAGEWVKKVANVMGGNGGGRDDFATAGGKNLEKIEESLIEARDFVQGIL